MTRGRSLSIPTACRSLTCEEALEFQSVCPVHHLQSLFCVGSFSWSEVLELRARNNAHSECRHQIRLCLSCVSHSSHLCSREVLFKGIGLKRYRPSRHDEGEVYWPQNVPPLPGGIRLLFRLCQGRPPGSCINDTNADGREDLTLKRTVH